MVEGRVLRSGLQIKPKEVLGGAFFWLAAFYFIYSGRPEDWVTVLAYIPLAKITGIFAMLALLMAAGRTPRRYKDLPREASYLLALIGLMFLSGFLSPVWKGGAVNHTIDFAKVYVAWVLTFLLITTMARLRRIIFIQAASVAAVSAVAIIKGHSVPRLNGVIGGIYSNPNDLAFAIVLSVPFCLAFLITSKGMFRKLLWCIGLIAMSAALFLSASRAGFINMIISGTVCLWHFGVRGKRFYLIIGTMFLGLVMMIVFGARLRERMSVIIGSEAGTAVQETAYESYEERKELMILALGAIAHYPILGVGCENFVVYSGLWKEVHSAYLQIGAEGGVAVLVLYILFFKRGFRNLKDIRRMGPLDTETNLFVGALHASLIGFVIGAFFAPEAYQFFAYFAVAFTSVLYAIVKERQKTEIRAPEPQKWSHPYREMNRTDGATKILTPTH
ncbi:MAG TPA: O-antigen ligase family protein [Terriglobales bacterium]|nr:O-antigen ligase family protein [Terriglobales bacterium]